MFFPRLRNQAKWAFVFLILVFGGGFIFLGVGSGGLDLGQLLRDAFGNQGSSAPSLSEAQKEVREHPRSAVAHRQLARALESRNRVDEAIVEWNQYVALRPRDGEGLRHLGELQVTQAERYLRQAQIAYVAQQEANAATTFGPPADSEFRKGLGQDPIASAVSTKVGAELQEVASKYQTSATEAVETYKKLVKLRPNDQQAVVSLAQTAVSLQQYSVAIDAYERLLKFNLDSATRAQIQERIRLLKQAQAPPGG